ncbi:hypothetical protein [Methylobacterium sp. WL6]|uniref:hypothetical protein n=1 Tax=Methylobacterium sp. WL6 TaxID=2603901 RepID=UPI0011CBF34B|nr:hypothetical protein [Methylobacterium sp. WL6]TXN72383.1 hypothetical protein FV230_04990 [Methylobacterium sp. WL6]
MASVTEKPATEAERLGWIAARINAALAKGHDGMTFKPDEWRTILAALRSTGTGRSEAEATKAACLAVVRNVRKNYRPALTKSRYQAREIQQFFGGACGLIDEDISALDPAALNPPAREGEGDQP